MLNQIDVRAHLGLHDLCRSGERVDARDHRLSFFFFFNDTATTEIYTLSLQRRSSDLRRAGTTMATTAVTTSAAGIPMNVAGDRKSTRLNSSHVEISYAVFCLKKKK